MRRPDFVLDCSVAAHWLFDDESEVPGSEFALNLLRGMSQRVAVVPSLWSFEIAAMLRKGVMRKSLVRPVSAHMERLMAFDIRRDNAEINPSEIAELALDVGTSAYDAAYLHLCQRLKLPLATLDERLKPCAERARVKLLTFP